MFDSVVQVNLLQVERIPAIAFVQHAGGVVAHKVAKGRAEVVCRMKTIGKLGEFDAFATAWNDS